MLENKMHDSALTSIISCINYLEQHGTTQGIFRIPGSSQVLQDWKQAVEKGVDLNFEEQSPLNVAAFLKVMLQGIPGRIFPENVCKDFKSEDTDEQIIKKIMDMIPKLPSYNKDVLKQFLPLLVAINSNSHSNLMNAQNLSIVFTSTLFDPKLFPSDFSDLILFTALFQRVLVLIIDHWEEVFHICK